MTKNNHIIQNLTFEPLSKNNWDKFVDLFGERGACGNCWCMYFRLHKKEFENGKINNQNKEAMKQAVWENRPTGILAFYQDKAIGWCAFAPRQDFIRLEKSRVHKPIDDKKVWSIPCIFISKQFRGIELSLELLKAVIQYARKQKIKIIEAYPIIPTKSNLPDAFVWVGLYKTFQKSGFKIVDRKSKNRPMVRYFID